MLNRNGGCLEIIPTKKVGIAYQYLSNELKKFETKNIGDDGNRSYVSPNYALIFV